MKKLSGVIPHTTCDYNPQIDTYLGSTEMIKIGDIGHIDRTIFKEDDYYCLQNRFKEHAMKFLTNNKMAQYFLEQII